MIFTDHEQLLITAYEESCYDISELEGIKTVLGSAVLDRELELK